MKGLRNKVILSGIVLVFAFIATIGSTYAWFTVSTETTVEGVELEVAAANNLLIRARNTTDDSSYTANPTDPQFWETSLDMDYLMGQGWLGTEASPWRLKPGTIIQPSYTSYDPMTINQISNIGDPDRTLTPITTEYNANDGYYIELDLYLLSQGDEDVTISLDDAATLITATSSGAMAAVQNATRITIQMGSNTPMVIGNDTDYGYTFLGGAGESSTAPSIISVTGDYFNSLSDLTTQPTGLATSVVDIDDLDTTTVNLGTLTAKTPTAVTVIIYIEGWDAQATNDIIGALFQISFGFKAEEII